MSDSSNREASVPDELERVHRFEREVELAGTQEVPSPLGFGTLTDELPSATTRTSSSSTRRSPPKTRSPRPIGSWAAPDATTG